MAMIKDQTGLLAAVFNPNMLKGSVTRSMGSFFIPPSTDIVALTKRRWSKETHPHPLTLEGKAWHHKIFHFTPEPPVPGASMETIISYLIPPHPDMLKGKAFRNRIINVEPPPEPPVPGASMETIISYLIPPHPDMLKGKVIRSPSRPQDFVPPPDILQKSRYARQVEPNIPLLFRVNTTLNRKSFAPDAVFIEFTETYLHSYRIADAALGVFQLYIGEDAEPDFLSAPQATSQTLPFSFAITPPGAGTKTVNVVVRLQNEFGLSSFNVFKTSFVIDTAGNEVLGPISSPVISLLEQETLGRAVTVGEYIGDDINPADKWEFYAKEGSDPVPGVDAPVATGNLLYIGPIAIFRAILGDFTPGATLHVIATALRDADSERGNSVVSEIVLNLSPDLNEGTTFGGTVTELR